MDAYAERKETERRRIIMIGGKERAKGILIMLHYYRENLIIIEETVFTRESKVASFSIVRSKVVFRSFFY